jgi:purine nucleosidase
MWNTVALVTEVRMTHRLLAAVFLSIFLFSTSLPGQPLPKASDKVIIDTDIGDDIDDAFAVALALRSPELEILGISTTFGDTALRARLLDRLLGDVGRQDIAVAVGSSAETSSPFTQRRFAERGQFARSSHPHATDFILEQVRRYPGEVTLVALGPLMNLGALIDKDPDTFRKLRRVVLMGGSIERSYGDLGYFKPRGPEPEWNIKNDIVSARKLFASGVAIFMMPLDSTQLKLDEVKRDILFRAGTPLTDALTILYHQWGGETPTMFDPLTVAYSIQPELCVTKPMRIRIDDQGFTRAEPGSPNANVCLNSDSDAFFHFFIPRVAGQ